MSVNNAELGRSWKELANMNEARMMKRDGENHCLKTV